MPSPALQSVSRSPVRGLWPSLPAPLWLAFATVVGVLAANLWVNGARMSPTNFELGGEYGNIAKALVSGRGFSDPFNNGSGATGWMPPAFSFIIASAMWATKSLVAAVWVLIVLKALGLGMSAFLYLTFIKRISPKNTAIPWCFAGIWAVGLGFVYSTPHVALNIDDEWWIGLVLALIVYGFSELDQSRGRRVFAAAAGLAALSSPVLLAGLALMCGLRALYLARRRREWLWSKAIEPVLPALLVASILAGGWMIRTRIAVGVWAPIKTNGAYELWQAQCVARRGVLSDCVLWEKHPPNKGEGDRYHALGEHAYLAPYGRLFWESVRQAPGEYFWRVYNRALNACAVTEWSVDSVRSARIFAPDAMARLQALRIADDGEACMFWLYVGTQSEADVREKLQGTDLPMDAVLHYWRLARQFHDRDQWSRHVRGLMQAGLPIIAFLFATTTLRGRLRRWAWISMGFYAAYLAPYILISHFERYQAALLGLQALGVMLGLLAVREVFARRRRPTGF